MTRLARNGMLALVIAGCSNGTGVNPQNALYTVIVNRTADSAIVVLKNYETGPTLRQQIMHGGDSTCWTTAIAADSAFYNVAVWAADSLWYPFGRGIGMGGFTVRNYDLQSTHKWIVTVVDTGPPPSATINGLLSGPGCS